MSKTRREDRRQAHHFGRRAGFVLALFGVCLAVLAGRAVQLQLFDNEFLEREGDARHLRTAVISAHRGTVTDRNGEPLAVSTPVDSVWANPKELAAAADRLTALADAIAKDPDWLKSRVSRSQDREFVYLRRHMSPDEAARVRRLHVPGVYVQREYRRYYPTGEVTGHLLGFTNIDDEGQEGLELAYDHWLKGEPGAKRVLKDRLGRTIEDVDSIRAPNPGKTLTTSVDMRIQYLAYRELKAALIRNRARSGSAVVLDVTTGEVLAMVNQPAYNPNDRAQYTVDRYRNRAVTDIFEPGSSLKPLVIAAALESGRYDTTSIVDTSPGFVKVGAKVIEDPRNLGKISLATILAKSSNVGATKVALSLEPEFLWATLEEFGVGQLTTSGFPGESAGLLTHYSHWPVIGQATLSYGYGLSVTPLQLAQAYATIAAGGIKRPISLVRVTDAPAGTRVIARNTAGTLVSMLERVVSPNGSGRLAGVPGYRIAGKTGTAWKYESGGYSKDKYVAVFAGIAPAGAPRIAAVVVIDQPRGDLYYGGDVAAPIFSHIVSGALRLMAIPPDAPYTEQEPDLLQANRVE